MPVVSGAVEQNQRRAAETARDLDNPQVMEAAWR